MDPFGDARDLHDDAAGAHDVDQLVDREVVAAHVDLADDQDFGQIDDLPLERDFLDFGGDAFEFRKQGIGILFDLVHHLVPGLVEGVERAHRVFGGRLEAGLDVLHVVGNHDAAPQVAGEAGTEFGVGIVGRQGEDDDVLEAHVLEQVFVEYEVLSGAARPGGYRNEKEIEFVLPVLLGREILERAAEKEMARDAFLAGSVGAGHLDGLAGRDGHRLGVHADAPEGRSDEFGGDVSHVGEQDLDALVVLDLLDLARDAVAHFGTVRAVLLELPAVVVAFLLDLGFLRAVALDDVEEGFDAGVDARVGRVGVELEDEEGFLSHQPLDVVEDERIRRAREVRDEGDVDIRFVLEEFGGLHVLLSVIPVHVREYVAVVVRQEVERNDRIPARGEFPRDAHVRLGGERVVRAAEHRDDGPVGLARVFECLLAERLSLREEFVLLFAGDGEGFFYVGFAYVEETAEILEMFEGLLVSVLETDDEGEEFLFGNVRERFLDVVRQALRDRAEVGVYVRLVARHVAEVRQEHVVGALVEAVLHRAVSDLRGEAVGALGPGDAFMRHFCGEEGLDPEFVEKPGVQGIERMYRERARDADGVVASGLECGAVRSAFDEEKVLPFFDIVEYRDVLDGFPHVRVFVAAAAEVVGMAVDLEHLDRAEIVARFTGEHPLVADLVRQQLRDVEVGFLEEVFGVFLLGEHGDAETAHQLG